MSKKPVFIESKIVAASHLFKIESVHLRFSNGQERLFERLLGQPYESVMVVPLLDNETVLLIREYGVGIEDYYLGFPKGAVHHGEDIYEAANRELMEEIGYGAKNLQILKSLSSSPAYSTKSMHIILAKDLYEKRVQGDEPEEIEVVPWKLNQLDTLLARADFHEARSIAALYMVRDLLDGL